MEYLAKQMHHNEDQRASLSHSVSPNLLGKIELCLKITNRFFQNSMEGSASTNELQLNKQPIKELLDDTLKNKGEWGSVSITEVDPKTVEINGMSNLTLHTFLLEAEKQGRKIEFLKTTTIKIGN